MQSRIFGNFRDNYNICHFSKKCFFLLFSRASHILRGATQPVQMRCVSVLCECMEIFFRTTPPPPSSEARQYTARYSSCGNVLFFSTNGYIKK